MKRARELIAFGVGAATGALLLAGTGQVRVVDRWISREPSPATDRVTASSAHAESASEHDLATNDLAPSSPQPIPSMLPPDALDDWLRTLPLDTIRRAYDDQSKSLDEKIAERFPQPKSQDTSTRQRNELIQALSVHGDRPGYWIGESTITAGEKSFDLTFFLRMQVFKLGDLKPLDLSLLKDDKSFCIDVPTYARGDGKTLYVYGVDCGPAIHVRGKWMLAFPWKIAEIEKSYTSYALAFPPLETTNASFELLGTNSQWTDGPGINWRQIDQEEFDERESKLREEARN